MSVWDTYQNHANVRGDAKREAALKREIRTINNRLPDSLSYQIVDIYDGEHGYNITGERAQEAKVQQRVAIINSDNLNEKMIISLPGEDIENGSLVFWMDNYWLVVERDANVTVYTKAKLLQCNHLLRWVSDEGLICEQWCCVEDGTKYLTGEFEDRNFVITRGDSRIYLTIARNTETVKLDRTRRFIIDDEDSPRPLVYSLTKPLKLGGAYNKMGVYKFVLQEVQATEDDNIELRIADYYKSFPKVEPADTGDGDIDDTDDTPTETGKTVWL